MSSNPTLMSLKSRFRDDHEWSRFLDFVETRRVRGSAEELWLQWDIHRLTCQATLQPWPGGGRYRPEAHAPLFR